MMIILNLDCFSLVHKVTLVQFDFSYSSFSCTSCWEWPLVIEYSFNHYICISTENKTCPVSSSHMVKSKAFFVLCLRICIRIHKSLILRLEIYIIINLIISWRVLNSTWSDRWLRNRFWFCSVWYLSITRYYIIFCWFLTWSRLFNNFKIFF
jgi:hypothetical protein